MGASVGDFVGWKSDDLQAQKLVDLERQKAPFCEQNQARKSSFGGSAGKIA